MKDKKIALFEGKQIRRLWESEKESKNFPENRKVAREGGTKNVNLPHSSF